MKKIFVIACKIIGLLQLYWAFATLLQIGFAFSMWKDAAEGTPQNVAWLAGTVLYSFLSFAVACIMIFKTDRLASIVGLHDHYESVDLPSQEALLRTGILLIGIYFVLVPIPGIVKHIVDALHYNQMVGEFRWISQTAGSVCQISLAVFLLAKPDKVIDLITRKKDRPDLIH